MGLFTDTTILKQVKSYYLRSCPKNPIYYAETKILN